MLFNFSRKKRNKKKKKILVLFFHSSLKVMIPLAVRKTDEKGEEAVKTLRLRLVMTFVLDFGFRIMAVRIWLLV